MEYSLHLFSLIGHLVLQVISGRAPEIFWEIFEVLSTSVKIVYVSLAVRFSAGYAHCYYRAGVHGFP